MKPLLFAATWLLLAMPGHAGGEAETDWTRAFAVVNYEQAVEPFRLTDQITESERATLMGGACARVYGWTPGA